MIPIDEQPYPLPDDWQWVTIKDIADVKGGKRLPKGKNLVNYKTRYPYIRVTDFFDNTIKADELKYLEEDVYNSIKRYTISSKDVYISIAGSIGKVGTIPLDLDGANLTENAAKITRLRGVNQSFLMWFLTSDFAQGQIKDLTKSTTQPKLALFRIEKIPIPLPPLDEQQRIVALLDELFADIDEAKALAQAVVDSSKLRRAAILHKAFTGELSWLWRDEHDTTLDGWQRTFWGKCGTFIAGSAFKKDFQGLQDYETPFYKVGSLKFADDGGYLFDESDTINEDIRKELKAKLIPTNSLLFAKIGEATRLNRRALNRVPCCIDNNMMAFIPEKILLRYAFHWSRSVNLYEYANATTVPAIRKSDLEKIPVPLPPLEEQKEIVRLLDDLLGRDQRTTALALKTIERVELMKKSILARAFRGELGTNK